VSIVHEPVVLGGKRVGDLVSLGRAFVFYTTHERLAALDGKVFAHADAARAAVRAALASQTTGAERLSA